jgi:RNA polymerase subunit RPABC4/transcription elongation factor Spt4
MKTGVSMLRACPECKNLVNDDELSCACDDDEYPEYDSDGEQ